MDEIVYDKVGQCPVGIAFDTELMDSCSCCTCERIDPADPGASSVEATFNSFSYQKQFEGSGVALDDDELLGRICSLKDTAKFLADNVPGIASRSEAEKNLRWLAGLGSSEQRIDAQLWFDSYLKVTDPPTGRGLTASPFPCWLFLGDNNATPLQLLSDSENVDLPCRLGLPLFLAEKPKVSARWFLGFVIPSNQIRNPKQASVFDSNYQTVREVWLPGGQTEPLPWAGPTCLDKGGLPEILSEQPTYDQFLPQVFVFESRPHP